MNNAGLWLAGVASLPVLVIAVSFLRLDVERLRRLSVTAALTMMLAALVIALSPALRMFSIRASALSRMAGGEAIVRVDTLSSVLLPFAAGLWLLTVAVTPRAAHRPMVMLISFSAPPCSREVRPQRPRAV